MIVSRRSSDLLSKKGQDAASRWLGVRDFLAQDDAFHSLPPDAVAVWDRYLAYAAAMGVAKDAAKGLLLAFRTRASQADHERAMAMLHDPLGAIAAMPPDLRPDSMQGFGQAEPFGPASDDLLTLIRGMVQGGPGVLAELAAGVSPERQAAIGAAVRCPARPDRRRRARTRPRRRPGGPRRPPCLVGRPRRQRGVSSNEELQPLGERIAAALRAPAVAPAWSRLQAYLQAQGFTAASLRG